MDSSQERKMENLSDKVVFITGATSGIGEEIAYQYAQRGASVAFTGRRAAEGERVAAKLEAAGGKALFIKSDVSIADDITRAIDATVKKYGRIDIAINNAGIAEQMTPFLEQKVQVLDDIFATNVRGLWLCMQGEIRQMLSQKTAGAIVNVSSVSGTKGFPGTASYVASKHAVNGLTKTLATEFAKENVRINAVAPGPIRTEMWDSFAQANPQIEGLVKQLVPQGRIGTCAEVASCVLWLTSDGASNVTGQIVAVDGGILGS
jgi:NAD(P)-dependent dehydrogenase (short-subunit alcohol dehydrogenase family)